MIYLVNSVHLPQESVHISGLQQFSGPHSRDMGLKECVEPRELRVRYGTSMYAFDNTYVRNDDEIYFRIGIF